MDIMFQLFPLFVICDSEIQDHENTITLHHERKRSDLGIRHQGLHIWPLEYYLRLTMQYAHLLQHE